ncbi:hypothetical protein K3172_10270 [Qipengyuania sp. 6B39]|uniref:hypothetical protein n=1 Tax=Qipengyuania proteolytica TaxID=2867239 RepID=UPI001C899D76|nr:hypothetical protein [Qipengyuania proteolytica]MBX7496237.1 hypothetical protein [Qipengyuania proteolytica]
MMQSDTHDPRDFDALAGLEGAIDWWREAGVDHDFSDEPTSWLAEPEDKNAVAAAPPPPPVAPPRPTPLSRALEQDSGPPFGGDRAGWPDSLEKFREWWMTEPSLADGALDRRAPPRGAAGAKLLVLVPQAEPDDGEGLLTGGAGRLLEAMLQAMGIGMHEVYLASVLPAPMALPEWATLAARSLDDLTRHHIGLAAPQRVLAIGRAQLALFGIPPEKARDPLVLDCGDKPIPLLATPDFSQIARSAARRERLWHRWLEWTA